MSGVHVSANGDTSIYLISGNDTIVLSSEEALIVERMVKEKYVEQHHTRKISFLENKGLWRTHIGNPRKEVTKKSREALIDYLYDYYQQTDNSNLSILNVFDRLQEYRRNSLNRAPNTIDRDRQAFRRLFERSFLMKKIRNVTDTEIANYLNKRSKELQLKERALQDSVRILCNVFDYAMKQEKIINDNPVKRIDLQNYYQNCDTSMKSSDEKIFTEEEITNIKEEIRSEINAHEYDIYGYAILFSIETGVRVAEIPPLRWEDISKKGIHIHRQQRIIKVKGKKRTFEELPFTKNERRHPKDGRYFPITKAIENILKELKFKQIELGIKSEFIFCNEDGNWIDKDIYAQRLRRFCRRMGLSITNNHAFRMSLNSNVFIPKRIPVTQRAYLLGHSVETNERFYSYMRTDSLEDIKAVLDETNHTRSHTQIYAFKNKKIPQVQ